MPEAADQTHRGDQDDDLQLIRPAVGRVLGRDLGQFVQLHLHRQEHLVEVLDQLGPSEESLVRSGMGAIFSSNSSMGS